LTADAHTRQRFEGITPTRLVKVAASLRPRPTDPVRYASLLAIRTLARRVAYLERESAELTRAVKHLIEVTAPGLLGVYGVRYGVGYDVAARLLVAAGDNPERLRSEAAWARSATSPARSTSTSRGSPKRVRIGAGPDPETGKRLRAVQRTDRRPRPTRSRSQRPRPTRSLPPTSGGLSLSCLTAAPIGPSTTQELRSDGAP
jgi:hypothetical protein